MAVVFDLVGPDFRELAERMRVSGGGGGGGAGDERPAVNEGGKMGRGEPCRTVERGGGEAVSFPTTVMTTTPGRARDVVTPSPRAGGQLPPGNLIWRRETKLRAGTNKIKREREREKIISDIFSSD